MAKEQQVKAFLKALKEKPQAKELLESVEAPKNDEERIQAYIAIAGKLGYSLTAEDFTAFEQAAAAERMRMTDAQAEALEKLDDQELEDVAGGQRDASNGDTCCDTHGPCDYSFKNRENCWTTDGCDWTFIHYDDYTCKNNESNMTDCYTKHLLGCESYF
ncbi:MAG: Nif11 family protein [Clostridia bacterium]|nr:Nif11 family protein [Clostridia bacterium]